MLPFMPATPLPPYRTGSRDVPPSLRVAQMMVGALAAGVLLFAGIVGLGPTLGIGPFAPAPPPPVPAGPPGASPATPPLLLMWAATGFGVLVMWLILRGVLLNQARRQWAGGPQDEAAGRQIVQAYVIRSILWAALLEGWGLFGCVTAMITGHVAVLAGPIAAVAAMLAAMPSPARLGAYVSKVTGRDVREA